MSLRHIKPQAALIATTRTQIGQQPLLGVSVGLGFRLSAPSILVHEAAVWEALKAVPASVPLAEAAMPKSRAEWLLMGHSTCQVPLGVCGGYVDWTAQIDIDGVRKTLSCKAPGPSAAQMSGSPVVRLPIDAAQAYAGPSGDNPHGTERVDAPLQRVGMFGANPAPLASTGPLGIEWPERAQWAPSRPASLEAMASDGTHMGWPQHVDLRLFQQAAPDQWAAGETWPLGAHFELTGFGPHGHGCSGALPRLSPVALLTRVGQSGIESLTLRQQTLWLLPDHDIGVLWWNGSAALEYLLDDLPDTLVLAFRDEQDPVDTEAVMSLAAQRADPACDDPEQQLDHLLMPAIARGWIWEMILDADDHPRSAPSPRSHAEHVERFERYRRDLHEAQRGQARLDAFRTSVSNTPLPEPPAETRDWLAYFRTAEPRHLAREAVRHIDFSSLTLEGWRFDEVRFEHCKFDDSVLLHCTFENTHAADCSFAGTKLDHVNWKTGSIARCDFARSAWRQTSFEQINFDHCGFDELKLQACTWITVSAQGRGGARGQVEDCVWRGVAWHDVEMSDWHWVRLEADNLGLVESRMPHLALTQCAFFKFSTMQTDLSSSRWQRSSMTFAVFSEDTSLERAHLSDCMVRTSSFLHVQAADMHVDHCTLIQFSAPHLHAQRSVWTATLLEGARLTHADFKSARFEHCSLKEAMLYGADLRDSRVHDSNLIHSRTGWTHAPEPGAWRANLTGGRVELPRRPS
jgi:uncharacterized protein YjbI with pentapeptide repeats